MPNQVSPLTLRQEKGAPLTAAEMDENLKVLRDFSNGLATLLGVALNPNGTIKASAVNSGEALANRIITQAKLGFLSAFYATETSIIPDKYTIGFNPPFAGPYSPGLQFFFRARYGNTGASTLNVDEVGEVPLCKNGSTPLIEGDIKTGQIIHVMHDGTRFQLVNTFPRTTTATYLYENKLPLIVNTGIVQAPGAFAWTQVDVSPHIVSAGFSNPTAAIIQAEIGIEWIATRAGSDVRRAATAKFSKLNTSDATLDEYRKVSAALKKNESWAAGTDTAEITVPINSGKFYYAWAEETASTRTQEYLKVWLSGFLKQI